MLAAGLEQGPVQVELGVEHRDLLHVVADGVWGGGQIKTNAGRQKIEIVDLIVADMTSRRSHTTHRGPLDGRVLVRVVRVARRRDGVAVGRDAARDDAHVRDGGCVIGCRKMW